MYDIKRLVRTNTHKAVKLIRQKPKVFFGLLGAVALIAGASTYVKHYGLPQWRPALPQGIAILQPSQVELAHRAFEAGKKAEAIRAYDTALTKDPSCVDEKMVSHLLDAFGTKEQHLAAAVIMRHNLTQAENGLEVLANHPRYGVRWTAVRTLERLGKAGRTDFVNAWMQDLKEPKCEVRQVAMEKLGKAGDRRALGAIRAARKEDEAHRGFLGLGGCLGGRPDEAEKRLARK
jgi:hypothetical protein